MLSRNKRIIETLKKYGVFTLTPYRRITLAETLMSLEKKSIKLSTAKKRIREAGILFTPKIIRALEKASKA